MLERKIRGYRRTSARILHRSRNFMVSSITEKKYRTYSENNTTQTGEQKACAAIGSRATILADSYVVWDSSTLKQDEFNFTSVVRRWFNGIVLEFYVRLCRVFDNKCQKF
ncbi:uncharacterized protein LOC143184144 [Calliopsis andreniformis]|uniref:uncharacterized protein LOC143184144 n=1 Tax=Calliopsis andreniformis TaxID=337506 RepID=UPI003FCC490B